MKYTKPKILMLDMTSACADALRNAGYNISEGTFGQPWKVPANERFSHSWTGGSRFSCALHEQEILFASIANPTPLPATPAYEIESMVSAYYQSNRSGFINPRPLSIATANATLEKVFQHNGLAVVFIDDKETIQYYCDGARGVTPAFRESNWSLLRDLDCFEVSACQGNELYYENGNSLSPLLQRCEGSTDYGCTIRPGYAVKEAFFPIIRNKYGECVAGALRKRQ